MSHDSRRHRGPHPQDPELFSASVLATLRSAVEDLSWLLSRGYSQYAALSLVGDRHRLRERQRSAVRHCACSEEAFNHRRRSVVPAEALRGRSLAIDGFNLLITLEAALGGGVLVSGREGCLRDLSGIHGSYRFVQETEPALDAVGRFLADHGAGDVIWFLDEPVSNSGRLRALLTSLAAHRGWPWAVELHMNPDRVLKGSDHLIVSSDAAVLDSDVSWVNLASSVVERHISKAWVLNFSS